MAIEMTPELARGLLGGKRGRRKVSDADVAAFIEKWDEHEPVMPVSMVCDAMTQWQQAHESASAIEEQPSKKSELMATSSKAGSLFFAIRKSNLLWRLIYLGERVRTRPCPKHRGRWSGCVGSSKETGCDGACLSGNNVTGWLPEPGDEPGELEPIHVTLA